MFDLTFFSPQYKRWYLLLSTMSKEYFIYLFIYQYEHSSVDKTSITILKIDDSILSILHYWTKKKFFYLILN